MLEEDYLCDWASRITPTKAVRLILIIFQFWEFYHFMILVLLFYVTKEKDQILVIDKVGFDYSKYKGVKDFIGLLLLLAW